MEIVEATKKAIQNNGYIFLKSAPKIKIKPTDTSECCKLYAPDGNQACGWSPRAYHLISDDWDVDTTLEEK